MRVLGGRAVQAVLVALLVGTACFLMVRLLPGDMAYRIAASRYGYDIVDSAAAEAVRQELRLDRPWFVQLGAWFADLSRFDLGTSLASGRRWRMPCASSSAILCCCRSRRCSSLCCSGRRSGSWPGCAATGGWMVSCWRFPPRCAQCRPSCWASG
ncbi:hypothetical protein ACFQU7_29115 [Pseudoroseomonas wenyumeiae]